MPEASVSPTQPSGALCVGPELTQPVAEHVYSLLAESAEKWPERTALDFLGKSTSFRALRAHVDAAAEVLSHAGVQPGDVVAAIMPNCPQHMVLFYAAMRLGAVVAEHNPLAAPEEIRSQLQSHGARVVVAWEKSVEKHAAALDGHQVFAVNLTACLPARSRFLLRLPIKAARDKRDKLRGQAPEWAYSWDKAVRKAKPSSRPVHTPSPHDIAVLLPTGGTTGAPKLVKLTHSNLTHNVAQALQWVPALRPGEETFASTLPWFHAFGLTLQLTSAIAIGATQVIFPTFDVDMYLAAQKRRPITFMPAVPPMLDRIEKRATEQGADLSSIRFAISGAMPLSTDVATRWEKVTGGYVIEGYGMSETSPIALGSPLGPERRPGMLGLPFPGISVRIVDPELLDGDEDGNGGAPQDERGRPDASQLPDAADGQPGELLISGPNVFAGYLNNEAETNAAFTADGWLRTGDVVKRDPTDGFLGMADRRKELIISGGFNIYPSQVEDAMRNFPGIRDVAVVGTPDGSRGEQVVAALVLEPGVTVELDQIREWLEGKISRYALPRSLEFFEELPRSQLGKVMRRRVREQIMGLREQVESAADAVRQRFDNPLNAQEEAEQDEDHE